MIVVPGSLVRRMVTLVSCVYEFAEEFGYLVDFEWSGGLLLGLGSDGPGLVSPCSRYQVVLCILVGERCTS